MRTTQPASGPGSVQHYQQWKQPAQHQTPKETMSFDSSMKALFQLKELSSRDVEEKPTSTEFKAK